MTTDLIEFKNIGSEADPLPFVASNIHGHALDGYVPRDDDIPRAALVQLHQPPVRIPLREPQPEIVGQIEAEAERLERHHLLHLSARFFFREGEKQRGRGHLIAVASTESSSRH